MNIWAKLGLGLLVVAVAVAVGRFTAPSKIVEKEKIVTVEKIVEKKVYVNTTNKKNRKTLIRLVTVKPDGTRTTETRIVDNSELVINQSGSSDRTEDVTKTTDKSKVTEFKKESTIVSAAMKWPQTYGLAVDKRLLGPIWVGGFGFMDQSFGLKLGVGF